MRKWLPLVLVAGSLAFSAVVYPRLPDRMPVHWGFDGEIDRYGSRVEGAFLLPVVMLAIWALMRWLPTIDPRRANYAKFQDTYDLVITSALGLFTAMHVAIVGTALGWPLSIGRLAPALVGLLFVVLGNSLPRARPNWWFGIRTPWTLSNDRVWMRTHRVGGYLLLGAGLVFLVAAALPSPWTFGVAIAAAIAASVGSIIYSYLVWKEETAK
jgi:uncharacterized membrane protein